MSVGTLSSQQLRSLVEDKWRKDLTALAMGLHVARPWEAPKVVEFEFGKAHVVRADTVFQVREALLDAERSQGRIILLTRLQQGDLGNDVVARLARSRLFAIDHWASLCSLFKAKELDRSVCDSSLAEALLEWAPPDGYPPVSAGVLDAGTVWRATCRHVFEMGEREPDLVTLLLWATNQVASSRYLNVNDELRASLRQRLVTNLGDAAASILSFVDCGAGPDALALAVVCQVVFGDGKTEVLDAAAARMEQYHQNKPVARHVGQSLAKIANDAISDLDRIEDQRLAQRHLQRADELLKQFRCHDHAYRGRLTPLGFEQRLSRFGAQVETTVATPTDLSIAECERLQAEITDHRIARLGGRIDQISRTQMAERLIRWLSRPVHALTSFSEFAQEFRKELSFVDWARESICRGDDNAGLSKAYHLLDQATLERRESFNRLFAQSLSGWASVGSAMPEVWGVEDLIPNVVFPIAKAGNRVLLIVLDGMSWAVCHELLDDIRREHWFLSTLDASNEPPRPVIATIPSVTSFSRASLLSGKIASGDAAVETRNFASNPHLEHSCDKRFPPLLFHKKELTDGARGPLDDDLRQAVYSTNHRVIGVVINAIDDRLAGAPQILDDWRMNRIWPLGPLLTAARDAGRVVILASDHGHVWHRALARNVPIETGGRWRPKNDNVADDEITLSGKRVRGEAAAGGSVIVPWSEQVYYGRQQNGYHGGASPQEMVCPVVLLTDRSSTYAGLNPCELPKPEWWLSTPTRAPVVEEEPAVVPLSAVNRGPSLFDKLRDEPSEVAPQAVESTKWIERLFSSQVYKDQKEQIRRHAPEDGVVRRALFVLESNGRMMTPAAFSNAAAIPAARLDGVVALIQRLLNVDGYEILAFDRSENKIELNVAKLIRQFDLG
jgi:PglZ domain